MSGRFARTSVAGTCLLLLVFVSSLASAGGSVHVARAPGRAPTAGHVWMVKLLVRPVSFKGAVRLVATGPRPLAARARGGHGVYRASLVFPQTGTWKLAAVAGGSRSRLGSIRVRPAPPVIFDQPTGVDVSPDDSLLVVESGRQRLVRVRPETGKVTPVATFTKPWGVARAPSGSIFVSDQGSLKRIDGNHAPATVLTAESGLEVGPVAVAPNGDVFCATAFALYRLPEGRPGTPERLAAGTAFSSPHGLTIASDGAVLVSDTDNNRILRVDPLTGAVTTFAELGHPRGIDVAPDGSVYVSAADEHHVVHLSAAGNRLAVVGPRFGDPYALAVGDGIVYAIDAGVRGLVRRIDPATVTWSRIAPLPHPRSAHAAVAAGGSIYVVGGPSTAAVDRFDGSGWQLETNLPGGIVNAPAAAVVGNTLVFTGGFLGSTNAPTDAVRLYDLGSHTWRSGAPLPAPRGGHAAAVLDGHVHVIGGGNSSSTIADHSVYDLATDTWTSAAPLPRAEGSPAAVALDGKLYAIGGRSGSSDYGNVYVYDPQTDAWAAGPSIPPRGTAGAVVYRGAIYVFGGESQARARTLADVYRLTPGASRWTRIGGMPTARNYPRAVPFGEAVFLVGGSRTAGDSHGNPGSTLVDRFFIPPG